MSFNPNMLTDPLGGINMAFGTPTCLVGLAKDALSILPGNILGGMAKSLSEGRAGAQGMIAEMFEGIHDSLGILEYDTTTGKLSLMGNNLQSGDGGAIATLLGGAAGAGQALWQAGQDVTDQLDAIQGCLDEFKEYREEDNFEDEEDAQSRITRTKGEFFVMKSQVVAAQEFVDQVNETLNNISDIMGERSENPDLIPFIGPSAVDLDVNPIFRLSYGPPKAKTGQFLLSVDGIYYDSQTRTYADGSPVPTEEDLQIIPDQSRWKLDHAPNLGGRGSSYSINDLNRYVDTIFDIDKIDNNSSLQNFYTADHLLQVLESQRNQAISNLEKNIVTLRSNGYSPDSALHINYREQIKSQNAAYNRKINKRKKQIEVAVKAPDLFGATTVFSPGEIPINDFSYLSSINLSVNIAQQSPLVFDNGEVSGVILPIVPIYVHDEGISNKAVITPLEIPPTGIGSNIEGQDISGVTPLLSLTTNISTHGLQAVYNFADVNTQTPSSLTFNTLNCAALGMENRAQLVSDNLPLLYRQGLGIPYLAGIPRIEKENANNEFLGETWSTYPFNIGGVGNYLKLPDTSSFQNLLYSPNGATIDVWTHMPGLDSLQDTDNITNGSFPSHPYTTSAFDFELSSKGGKWCDAHYYRVLLGCENTGGENLSIDQSSVVIDRDSTNVRGMVMGFSRDPRMYYEDGIVQPGSNDFVPRENYGGYVTSASNTSGWDVNGIEGIWTVSSDGFTDAPDAAYQASGTFKTAKLDGVRGRIGFTVTDGGDLYQSSSNDLCCLLYVSGAKGATTYVSGVSSVISVSPFNGNLTMNAGSSVFFIAPTQSYNTSSVGFVKNSGCRIDTADILKFVVSTKKSVGDVNFSDILSKFINLQIVFDPPNDSLKFYMNSVLFKEESLSQVFGVSPHSAPQIPSFMIPKTLETSSFYYSKDTVTQKSSTKLFDSGPNNYAQFTPWVVGGGWTDGRPVDLTTSSGGFLDPGAGLISSYNGYIGNLKIYNRALNITELTTNYKSQRNFFDNIDLAPI